jgi:hypothetical protein
MQTLEVKAKHISSIIRRLKKDVKGYSNAINGSLRDRLQWQKRYYNKDFYYVLVNFNNDNDEFTIHFDIKEEELSVIK